MNDVIVIGGGPAGMMAAYAAAERGLSVHLLEKNEKLGKKLFITGKGRCNLTNAADMEAFFSNVVRNPKFLMSSFHRFTNTDLLQLLQKYGLQTKTERGNRVFPISDKSSDVIRTLEKMLTAKHVKISFCAQVEQIAREEGCFSVKTTNGFFRARAVIVATGGVSYPLTGSTGDGYRFAESFEHQIVTPSPALVALEDARHFCERMQGLTLRNVGFTLFQNEKKIYEEQGELLFTHFGISGPVVLSASSYIRFDRLPLDLCCAIDLKPALSIEQVEARLLRDFEANANKQLKNYMCELMPSKLIYPFLQKTDIAPDIPVNCIKKEDRKKLALALKALRIPLADTRPIEEAVITAGGVRVSQINPSTMESKLVKDLYFAGEMIDVSAKTGGFNLQIAFSTGYLAGASVLN